MKGQKKKSEAYGTAPNVSFGKLSLIPVGWTGHQTLGQAIKSNFSLVDFGAVVKGEVLQ